MNTRFWNAIDNSFETILRAGGYPLANSRRLVIANHEIIAVDAAERVYLASHDKNESQFAADAEEVKQSIIKMTVDGFARTELLGDTKLISDTIEVFKQAFDRRLLELKGGAAL